MKTKIISLIGFLFLFTVISFAQNINELKTQLIKLSSRKDTSATLLNDQPYGARPNSYLKKSLRVGEIVLNEKKYKCALYCWREYKNYNYSHLWIDTNINGKYDFWKDILAETWLPFTVFGSSYRVTEVDSLGRYMKVEECNQKIVPPIQEGMQAPNIEFTTMNNEKLNLYSFSKNIKVLYFWSCDNILHAREMKKVVDHFKGREIDFINSSWVPSKGDKDGYPWVHFYNDPKDKQRLIYQVGSPEKMFIIDNHNKILSIYTYYPWAKEIIEAIEKVIKQKT